MQYEIYDKGGLMKKKRQNLELWMGELRDKVRKDGTISNKDIMPVSYTHLRAHET